MARVLVVEDNAVNLRLAEFVLSKAGHTVLRAEDASEGIALARSERPDLILMDVQLAGMDGLEATRLLRADPQTRGIRILALTALAMRGDEARILAAGCDAYLSKPYEVQELLAKVAAMLGEERAS